MISINFVNILPRFIFMNHIMQVSALRKQLLYERIGTRNKWRLGKIEKIEKLIAGKDGIIRGAEVKVAEHNKKPTVTMIPLQKLFPLETKENEIRPSSNPRMKKTDETNDELSKQIQEDEKKEGDDVNNDELFPGSPKNVKQSETEPLNYRYGNENVND